jgi:hypothetical protein
MLCRVPIVPPEVQTMPAIKRLMQRSKKHPIRDAMVLAISATPRDHLRV